MTAYGAATSRRIENAKARLQQLRADAAEAEAKAAVFGPHCRRCRYSSYGGDPRLCQHPVNQSVSVDWGGGISLSGSKRAEDMRNEGGGCGPEAALYDPAPFYANVPWLLFGGIAIAAGFICLAFSIEYGGPIAIMAIMGVPVAVLEFVWGRYA